VPARRPERAPSGDDAWSRKSAVAIRSLSVEFADSGASLRRVLSNVSLDVQTGQLLALIGPSGSGKTTILNVVSGLVSPTSGTAAVFGTQPVVGRPDVGYMFARDALLPWRTARQNVELALELRGVGRRSRRDRAAALLGRVHLSPAADQFPAALSQGMRQRVALARTWAADPACC
jgi:ABC-type nitrate/sulfonate/bicarbonate transport system ATPase subunit